MKDTGSEKEPKPSPSSPLPSGGPRDSKECLSAAVEAATPQYRGPVNAVRWCRAYYRYQAGPRNS